MLSTCLRIVFVIILSLGWGLARAQVCDGVFDGAAQNSSNNGNVTIQWQSRLINTPGNVVRTRNLNDYAGPNYSCNGVSCTATNTIVADIDRAVTAGGPSGTVNANGYLNPGSYGDVTVGNGYTLYLLPGEYEFTSLTVNWTARLALYQAGSTRVYIRNNLTTNYTSAINTVGGNDRRLLIYARGNVELSSNTTSRALIYARGNINMQSGAALTGALTANGQIALNSSSIVTYNADIVNQTNYGDFCTPAYTTPNLVGEWRLDELQWQGIANEVVDYSGNNLHGRAVSYNGLPETLLTNPVQAGDPGTCRYGAFDGNTDGYVQINDPGNNSILDLDTYSVTAWVYARTNAVTDTLMTIVSKDENYEFHINQQGRLYWWWGGGAQELTSTIAVPLNSWHHIAVTYAPGQQIIYIDGVVRGTSANTSAVIKNNDPFYIGEDLDFPSRMFNGFIDEVRIYDGALNAADVSTVMNETHPCIAEHSLDHFEIIPNATNASTCSPNAVTITAKNDRDETLADYTGTIEITTSSNNGRWSANSIQGELTASNDDSGTATYRFAADESDAGSIVLDLANQHAESLTVMATDVTTGISSSSVPIIFRENAFVVSLTDTLADDVIVGRDHLFQLAMYTREPGGGNCAIATDYSASTIKVWLERSANDPGGLAPAVVNSSNGAISLPDGEPGFANVTFPIEAGVAEFRLRTSDTGEYRLQFSDDSGSFATDAIVGSSALLVARPFAVDIQVAGNSGAADAFGNVFTTAGANFPATMRAVAWQAADDQNNDGIADGHSDNLPLNNVNLTDNPGVAHFAGEALRLSVNYADPAPGVLSGDLTPSMVNGELGITLNYSEVGVIEVAAEIDDGNYLSASAVRSQKIQGRSGNVGRFVPDHFDVANAALLPGCNAFSYMGQNFNSRYVLQAMSAASQPTRNYMGTYAKLNAANLDYVAQSGGNDLSARLEMDSLAPAWVNGEWTLDQVSRIARSAAVDGPFNNVTLAVRATDSDGIGLRAAILNVDSDSDGANDHFALGSQLVVYGRLRLDSAIGSELADLPITFISEFWNGASWQQSSADSCTAIGLGEISYPNGAISQEANRTITLGSGSTTGMYGNIDSANGTVLFSGGDAGHRFTAPGAGNTGSFDVQTDLSDYPWLRFDWNKDGVPDPTLPPATFVFGAYRGHDRIIYWRETLQ